MLDEDDLVVGPKGIILEQEKLRLVFGGVGPVELLFGQPCRFNRISRSRIQFHDRFEFESTEEAELGGSVDFGEEHPGEGERELGNRRIGFERQDATLLGEGDSPVILNGTERGTHHGLAAIGNAVGGEGKVGPEPYQASGEKDRIPSSAGGVIEERAAVDGDDALVRKEGTAEMREVVLEDDVVESKVGRADIESSTFSGVSVRAVFRITLHAILDGDVRDGDDAPSSVHEEARRTAIEDHLP